MSESTDHEETSGDFDALVAQYWDSGDTEAARRDGEALVSESKALVDVGRYDEAIAVGEAAIVGIACSVEIGELLARAILSVADAYNAKGAALIAQARYDEGIEALDEVITRFDDDLAPRLRRAVALALSNKVKALVRAGRMDEAFEARDYMIWHFAEEGVSVPELGGPLL